MVKGLRALKKVSNCKTTKNTFYSETSGGQNSSNPYLTAVHLTITIQNYISLAAKDGYFTAKVSNVMQFY